MNVTTNRTINPTSWELVPTELQLHFTVKYDSPDQSGVHIQGIVGPPESTLHPNQGSCSAHY